MSMYITPQMIDPNVNAPSSPATSGARGGPVRQMLFSVVQNWRRRKMIAALDSLDDRILWDIGIHRADIAGSVDRLLAREGGSRPASMPPASKATAAPEADRDVYLKAA